MASYPATIGWKKRTSKKLRGLVLWTLRCGRELTSHEVASELNMAWLPVCLALDDLMIRGQVDLDGVKFRRSPAAE